MSADAPETVDRKAILEELKRRVRDVTAALYAFREACPHKNVERKAQSNTGNYDPSADKYWYNCTCRDCEKFWTEDQ